MVMGNRWRLSSGSPSPSAGEAQTSPFVAFPHTSSTPLAQRLAAGDGSPTPASSADHADAR
eukprot:2916723-Lingulodinium_polyedra.AAC.1